MYMYLVPKIIYSEVPPTLGGENRFVTIIPPCSPSLS